MEAREPGKKNGAIAVSVVVPVYNSMPYFARTVDSLLAQTFDPSTFEVIVADDGSSDGSERLADEMARAVPELVRVVHLEPSGGPAHPRNVGLDMARGEYVFFLDSDDFLGPEALERMYAHAREWGSDVLVPKQVGENGRRVPSSMFRMNQPVADVWTSRVFYTLSPLKLFRTSLLRENDIRFPEQLRYREDEVFTSKALFCADVVSVAADYDYCHIVERDDGSNLMSETHIDFERNYDAVRVMIGLVGEHAPDWETAGKNVLPRIMRSGWFAAAYAASKEPAPIQGERYEKLVELLVDVRDSETLRARLPQGISTLIDALSAGMYEKANECFELFQVSPNSSYEGVDIDAGEIRVEDACAMLYSRNGAVAIDITSTIALDDAIEDVAVSEKGMAFQCSRTGHELMPEPVSHSLVLVRRNSDDEISISASDVRMRSDERLRFAFEIPRERFADMCAVGNSTWDCFLQFEGGGIVRRTRFGAHMTTECRNRAPKKGRLWVSSEGARLGIRYTPAGNIIFRVRIPE